MSERLQVILDDGEMLEIKRIARRHRMTVAEWVRQALRAARRQELDADARKKLAVVRAAKNHAFPIGEIDQILADIERTKDILLSTERPSSRDALHLAIMERHDVATILGFDTGFDGRPGVTRLPS